MIPSLDISKWAAWFRHGLDRLSACALKCTHEIYDGSPGADFPSIILSDNGELPYRS